MTTRTQDEIAARITQIRGRDFFGFEASDLIAYLDFAHAKPFLKPEVEEERWPAPSTADPRDRIVKYLPFAWDKANNRRGLSAARSMSHMAAWLWLMGKDAIAEQILTYSLYGKPELVRISELVGVDWRALDDDRWTDCEYEDGVTADEALGRISR